MAKIYKAGKTTKKGRTPTKKAKKIKISSGQITIHVKNADVFISRDSDKKPKSARRNIGW